MVGGGVVGSGEVVGGGWVGGGSVGGSVVGGGVAEDGEIVGGGEGLYVGVNESAGVEVGCESGNGSNQNIPSDEVISSRSPLTTETHQRHSPTSSAGRSAVQLWSVSGPL